MSTIDPDFPHDVYRFLIKPLRDADDSGILEGYVGGVQEAFEQTQSDQGSLLQLFDLDTCPAWALDYLLWAVGWSTPVKHIVADLTEAQKRKVLRLSAQLWKQKGTPTGIKNAVRLFTGRDVVYWSWFYMRIETDQSGFWYKGIGGIDPWLVGQTYGDRDEHLSICWIMDEDGTDRELIHDIVQLNRPMGEAIQVCYADLVDDFQLDVTKWSLVSGTEPTWDDTNFKMLVPTGAVIEANVIGLDALATFTLVSSFTFTSLTACTIYFMWDGASAPADCLAFTLSTTTWSLDQTVSSVSSNLDTGVTAIPIADPVGIVIHILDENSIQKRIKVLVDGVEEVDYLMTVAETAALVLGAIGYAATTAVMSVDNVIMFGHPLYCDTIEAGDATRDAEPGTSIPIWADVTPALWTDWNNWTVTADWHVTSFRYRSSSEAAYCGQGESGYHTWGTAGDHDIAVANNNATTGSTLDLSAYNATDHRIWLEWWQYTAISYAGGEDDAFVIILSGSTALKTYTKAETVGSAPSTGWERKRLDITTWAAAEATLNIRFQFNPLVSHSGSDEGWYVDDMRILVEKL